MAIKVLRVQFWEPVNIPGLSTPKQSLTVSDDNVTIRKDADGIHANVEGRAQYVFVPHANIRSVTYEPDAPVKAKP